MLPPSSLWEGCFLPSTLAAQANPSLCRERDVEPREGKGTVCVTQQSQLNMEACPFRGFGLHVCPSPGQSPSPTHRRHVMGSSRDGTAGPESCLRALAPAVPLSGRLFLSTPYKQEHLCLAEALPARPLGKTAPLTLLCALHSSEQPLILPSLLMVFFCLLPDFPGLDIKARVAGTFFC